MENTQSSLDEIYAYFAGNPKIKSYDNLLDALENGGKKKRDVQKARISKFVNNNIGKAKDLINGLILRRDRGAAKMGIP